MILARSIQVLWRFILLVKILWMELMATGGKSVPSGLLLPLPHNSACGFKQGSWPPWALISWCGKGAGVPGQPPCRVGMMVSWNGHGQASGALHRKMVPLGLVAGFVGLAGSLDFQPQGHWARQWCPEPVPTWRRHWADWWICMSMSNQAIWNYRISGSLWAQATWFFNISLLKESVIDHCFCALSLFCTAFLLSSFFEDFICLFLEKRGLEG